jgi:hypothetical protein
MIVLHHLQNLAMTSIVDSAKALCAPAIKKIPTNVTAISVRIFVIILSARFDFIKFTLIRSADLLF